MPIVDVACGDQQRVFRQCPREMSAMIGSERFIPHRKIGQGHHSAVYAAVDTVTGEEVAIKASIKQE